jgi:PIN domain nuclease of toxin-antitoxin system
LLYLSHPGFFGEVFRGIWNGTEVAVKVFLEQDLTAENMEDFCNEISILRYVIVDMLIAKKNSSLHHSDLNACSSCGGCACFAPAAFDILMVLSLTCYS